MQTTVETIMARSGVTFGTSGARGLAEAMTDQVCYAYAQGFLRYLRGVGELGVSGGGVVVGGDLRPSTGRILAAVCRAIRDLGHRPVHAGRVPSPAVGWYAQQQGMPGIVVTGSHIPDDRNGIKFFKVSGEVLKEDEPGMKAQEVSWEDGWFESGGAFRKAEPLPEVEAAVEAGYRERYLGVFTGRPLAGLRLGVYRHSAVGGDVLAGILEGLGATVVLSEKSSAFVPVDTEAVRPEDEEFARSWAASEPLDAVVSTDGDSDRPLISDVQGRWLRGDVVGPLCARYLGADTVVTPVSSNTVVERCGWFGQVRRTRIGSPYVVSAMAAAAGEGRRRVVGYEANGGFLLQSDVSLETGVLRALPTRDAVLPILGVLFLARREKCPVANLVEALPARFTASDRLKDFAVERSRALLARFEGTDDAAVARAIDGALGGLVGGQVTVVDRTDGLRVTFSNGEIVHLRPSGNAPEFRCYTEAGESCRASELCRRVLAWAAGAADR